MTNAFPVAGGGGGGGVAADGVVAASASPTCRRAVGVASRMGQRTSCSCFAAGGRFRRVGHAGGVAVAVG